MMTNNKLSLLKHGAIYVAMMFIVMWAIILPFEIMFEGAAPIAGQMTAALLFYAIHIALGILVSIASTYDMSQSFLGSIFYTVFATGMYLLLLDKTPLNKHLKNLYTQTTVPVLLGWFLMMIPTLAVEHFTDANVELSAIGLLCVVLALRLLVLIHRYISKKLGVIGFWKRVFRKS
jgi:hypothetical protein